MDAVGFKQILETYDIDPRTAYEDLSEMVAPLWHGDDLGLAITCAYDGEPKLSIVVVYSDDCYDEFELDLEQVSAADLPRIITWVSENENPIRDSLLNSDGTCPIEIDGRVWDFVRTE